MWHAIDHARDRTAADAPHQVQRFALSEKGEEE
jgi:hypothetical protein